MRPTPASLRDNRRHPPCRVPTPNGSVVPLFSNEPRTGAILRARGWRAGEIYRGVDLGLLMPLRLVQGGWSVWEFYPLGGRSWAQVQQTLQQENRHDG